MNIKLKMGATVVIAGVIGCVSPREPNDHELICRDRQVTVNHAAAFLAAHPEHLEICAGRNLVISIAPPVEAGSVKIAADEENRRSASWLRGTNRQPGRIVVRVPEDARYGTYKYSITIDGVGTLDPRVRVARR